MTVINVDYSGDVFVSSHTRERYRFLIPMVFLLYASKSTIFLSKYTLSTCRRPLTPPLSQSHPLLQTYLLRLENIVPEIEGGVPLTVELASVFRGKNCSK